MNAEFWHFHKRNNSTKHPPAQAEVALDVKLKDATSIEHPVLLVREPLFTYTYARIQQFGRYYFVTDAVMANGLYEVSLSCDVLASYKGDIGNTQARVLLSSSNYSLDAIDNRVASLGGYDRQTNSAPFAGARAGAQVNPTGYFALNVLNNSSVWATGTTTTYFLTYQQMQTFARELLKPDFWEGLKQFFANPMDGIIDCYYIPLDITQYIKVTTYASIFIGDYQVPNSGGVTTQATALTAQSHSVTIEIPWRYSDFRNLAPYSEISMFVPFCGSKSIPAEMCYDAEALLCQYSVDVISGAVQAIVYIKGEVIAEFSGNCRVNLPVGQTQSRVDSIIGAAGGAITAIAGFSSGNVALGATGVLSAVGSVITPATDKIMGGFAGSVLGAILGNSTSLWQQFHLSVTARDTSCEPLDFNASQGNVCNKVLSIGSLSGYCQTDGFSVQASCLDSERARINALMDSGVYLE